MTRSITRSTGVTMRSLVALLLISSLFLLSSCSNPQPGPDKTVAGAVLGAGWGAGAGAVVGNQIMNEGEGIAVGAGFGLVQGGLEGAGYDLNESALMKQQRELDSLKVANTVNQHRLADIQSNLDMASITSNLGGVYQVFFDVDATNLRAGAISNLEVIADSLLGNPHAVTIHVVGHSDDSGTPKYNARLSEARARNVGAYLAARGVSMDQIKVTHFGSKQPIASNETPVGRQLNRRVDVYVSTKKAS
jgi:outer membrane protein OmpA-like peptidoglycan-associated protein